MLPLVLGLGLALALFVLSRNHGLWEKWYFYVPTAGATSQWPLFGDLAVTLDHLREADQGLDPLSDPKSQFAYPRAVLALRHFGIHHLPAQWLGFLQGCCVTVAVVLLIRPSGPKLAVATMILLLSPALILGFERANLDFALFLLCFVCAQAWARGFDGKRLALPIGGMMVGAVLKLYPVFALIGGAYAETGKRRLLWLFGAVAIVVYWIINSEEMALIAQKIPVSDTGIWGCLVLFTRIERYLSSNPNGYVWLVNLEWPLIALSCYAAAGLIACYVGRKLAPNFNRVSWEPREWCAYWIGASICCGSFAGANFSYRWIFILLTVPLLRRLVYAADRSVALWSRLTLVILCACLVAPLDAGRIAYLLTQFANWVCIFLLIVGCTALRCARDIVITERLEPVPAEDAIKAGETWKGTPVYARLPNNPGVANQ